MSLIRLNKIFKNFSSLTTWVVYLLFLFLFTEFCLGIALNFYFKNQRGSTDFTNVNPEVFEELREVQKKHQLNLYRWYNNIPNYAGKYVTTDASGFRINVKKLNDSDIIGMFGGSTTFSTLTDQQGTIANLLSKKLPNYQVLNFGVGGYSTGAEIMTFVEAIRKYPKIQTAIFYDGANELGRAFDRFRERRLSNSSDLIGTPYFEGKLRAIRNENGLQIGLRNSNIYYVYRLISGKINLNKKFAQTNQVDDMLNNIVNRYFSNLKVINGICKEHDVICLFIWQPTLFTLDDKKLSKEEQLIKDSTPRSDYRFLTKKILSDERAKEYEVKNLTWVFDKKPSSQQIYYDWCHVSLEGNILVAEALAKLLKSYL